MMSRSAWTTLAISGRRTFRATIRPSRRTARWTCEIDAEATGVASIDAKISRGRPAVFLAQDRLDLVEWERADIIAQRRQLVGVRLGEQVGPGAQQLAQLHERRPQVLADQPEPARPVLRRDVVPQRDPLDRPHQSLQVERRDHVLIAVPHQGRQDLPVARQVSEMTDRFSNHAHIPSQAMQGRPSGRPARPDPSRDRLAAVPIPARARPSPGHARPSSSCSRVDDLVKLSLMLEM